MDTRRLLLVGWDVAVLAALAVYAGQFSDLPAPLTAFPRLITYPVAVFALLSLGSELLHLLRPRAAARAGGAGRQAAVRESGSPPAPRSAGGGQGTEAGKPVLWWQLLLGVALGIAYLLLWNPLGFELDSAVFLTATPALLGQPLRRVPLHALIGVVTAVVFTFLFHLGSGAILPAGVLGLKWP